MHTDARGYVRAIAEGNLERAYLIARGPNPLASICGCVCGAPCETACRRGAIDKPVAIRPLKRYVCGLYGPEARQDGGASLIEFLKEAAKRHDPAVCQGKEELLPLLQALTDGRVPRVEEASVGIIGSGPAGLAAAHDLALLGFSVTIYEMEAVLAGMLALGIPDYRLPRDLVRAEVEVITALGVKTETNCCVGEDVSLAELRARHNAVIIAVGARRSRSLPIPGAESTGVVGGVEFLRDVALGKSPKLGRRVVVIGGGNVAFDVGRTVLREIALDTARTARRVIGAEEVYLCSLESLEEMPADDIEIAEGEEEGIIRYNSVGPSEILLAPDGHVTGVVFQKCLRVFDKNKRFSPIFDDDELTEIPCDNVLITVGQAFDLSFVDPARDGLPILPNGMIECDPETGATAAPDVFVAGDMAHGPKLLIHAVASGKAVARAIYKRITGREIRTEQLELHFPLPTFSREPDYEIEPRASIPTLPVHERLASQGRMVEHVLTPDEARREARRCLNCGVNTIFNGSRCILCAGCVDVCPELCLRTVPLEALDTGASLDDILGAYLDEFPVEGATAIIKQENLCIRCSLCAERCPTGAITMEQFQFEERPTCQIG